MSIRSHLFLTHHYFQSPPIDLEMVVQSLSHADSCNPMNCSLSGSSVHGISPAEYQSGLPFPSPEDLPDPRIKPTSPVLLAVSFTAGRFFTTEPPGLGAGLNHSQTSFSGIHIDSRSYELTLNVTSLRDNLGGPVVKTLSFNAEGGGSIPDLGPNIPHASRPKKLKHKTDARL